MTDSDELNEAEKSQVREVTEHSEASLPLEDLKNINVELDDNIDGGETSASLNMLKDDIQNLKDDMEMDQSDEAEFVDGVEKIVTAMVDDINDLQ